MYRGTTREISYHSLSPVIFLAKNLLSGFYKDSRMWCVQVC